MWKLCKILKAYRSTPTFYNCTNKKSICDPDSKKKSCKSQFGKDESQEKKENLTIAVADFFKFRSENDGDYTNQGGDYTNRGGGYTNRNDDFAKSFGTVQFYDNLFLNITSALYAFNAATSVDREKNGRSRSIESKKTTNLHIWTRRRLAVLPLVDKVSVSTNQNASTSTTKNHVASQTEPSRDNSTSLSANQNTGSVPLGSRDRSEENLHTQHQHNNNNRHQLISTFHNLIGVDMIRSGLYPEAFEQFQKAVAASQSDTDDTAISAVYNLGMCYMKGYGTGQNMRKAVECWSRAAELGHSLAKYQMAVCYLRTGDDDPEKISADPEKFAYSSSDVQAKAGRLLKDAAEDDNFPEAQSLYGVLLYKQGRTSSAIDFLRKADQSGNEQASRVLRLIENPQINEKLAFSTEKRKNVQKPVPKMKNSAESVVHFFNDQSDSSSSSSSSDSSIAFQRVT